MRERPALPEHCVQNPVLIRGHSQSDWKPRINTNEFKVWEFAATELPCTSLYITCPFVVGSASVASPSEPEYKKVLKQKIAPKALTHSLPLMSTCRLESPASASPALRAHLCRSRPRDSIREQAKETKIEGANGGTSFVLQQIFANFVSFCLKSVPNRKSGTRSPSTVHGRGKPRINTNRFKVWELAPTEVFYNSCLLASIRGWSSYSDQLSVINSVKERGRVNPQSCHHTYASLSTRRGSHGVKPRTPSGPRRSTRSFTLSNPSPQSYSVTSPSCVSSTRPVKRSNRHTCFAESRGKGACTQ